MSKQPKTRYVVSIASDQWAGLCPSNRKKYQKKVKRKLEKFLKSPVLLQLAHPGDTITVIPFAI